MRLLVNEAAGSARRARSLPPPWGVRLRGDGRCDRTSRHQDWVLRYVLLELEARKFPCQECGRHFRQRLPGVRPWRRASAAFPRQIFRLTWTASTATF
jgi:hypothetical protein